GRQPHRGWVRYSHAHGGLPGRGRLPQSGSMTATPEPKVVLVTGASSGIGAATARTLATAGHHVILTARRTDRIAALASDLTADRHVAEARPLDVTDQAAFHEVVEDVVSAYGRLDVLVGNAGVMLLSRLDA